MQPTSRDIREGLNLILNEAAILFLFKKWEILPQLAPFNSAKMYCARKSLWRAQVGAPSHRLYTFRGQKRYAPKLPHYKAGVRYVQIMSTPSAMGVSGREINEASIPLPVGKANGRSFPFSLPPCTTGKDNHSSRWHLENYEIQTQKSWDYHKLYDLKQMVCCSGHPT